MGSTFSADRNPKQPICSPSLFLRKLLNTIAPHTRGQGVLRCEPAGSGPSPRSVSRLVVKDEPGSLVLFVQPKYRPQGRTVKSPRSLQRSVGRVQFNRLRYKLAAPGPRRDCPVVDSAGLGFELKVDGVRYGRVDAEFH